MSLHLAQAHRVAIRKAPRLIGATVLLLGATGFAVAQVGTAPEAGSSAQSNSQSNPKVPGKATPPSPSESSPEVTGTNDGVITPKRDVDPGMSKAPPSTGTESMPIVKPKGTPGGQPGATPK